MQIKLVGLVCLIATSIFVISCSSSRTTPLDEQAAPVATEPVAPEGMPSLWGLDDLPTPTHEVSMEGPGWYDIQVGTFLSEAGVISPHPINELPLSAVTDPAFAMYGVYGFDGDNGPTSARISATDIVGEYYIGFSDYLAGQWVFSGPFTGAATVEIPNENNYIHPSAFTSENGHCFITVVVPTDSSLVLTKVELGVHGGILGPQAPFTHSRLSSPAGIQFLWQHSVDVDKPDFAGYVIERAPQFYGDFSLLNTVPANTSSYVDNTAQEGFSYRYRISSEDVSGNRGLGRSMEYYIDPTDELGPILVLTLPQGPLFGPLDVDFDMSGSSDPEGEPIDTYGITFWGDYPAVAGADPIQTISMQPGCYIFIASITCGLRTSTTRGYVKIYPTWNESPVVIKSSAPNYSRGIWLVSGMHPTTGRLIHAVTDLFSDQFLLLAEDETGGLDYQSVHIGDFARCLQQPVAFNDQLLFLVQNNSSLQIAAHDGVSARLIHGTGCREQDIAGLASDGTDRVWMVVCISAGPNHHLNVIDTGVHTNIHNIVENTGLLSWIEAEYNPAVDALDIVYTIDGTHEMYWVRDNLDGVPGVPVEINPGSTCLTPAMTINPANGRPLVAYLNGATSRVQFTALTSDLVTWTAPEIIDDSAHNLTMHGMVLDGGYPLALIGLDDGTVNVYRRGAAWTKTNSLPDSSPMIAFCSLIQAPDGPGGIIAYRNTTFEIQSFRTHPDGNNTPRWTVQGIEPNGVELHGASGGDGLHVVLRPFDGSASHYVSADGAAWVNAPGVPIAENIDMVASRNGEIYLSYFQPNIASLDWWNGAGWTSVSTISTDALHRPILNYNEYEDSVKFACYDPLLNQMVFQNCEHGVVPVTSSIPTTGDVWAGLVSTAGLKTIQIIGGVQPSTGVVMKGFWFNELTDPVFYGGTSLIMSDDFFVKGKTMAHAHYHTKYMFGDGDAFWFVSSSQGTPVRVVQDGMNPYGLDNIELSDPEDYREPRRTVSAITTNAWTAVALLANLDGVDTHFEWSNYGDWETLPLPRSIENMMNPELIYGDDGRWHIIYRDWVTDDLLCISTL